MKILDKTTNKISLKIETLDDLWCLSTIIEKGDHISGKTFRKIQLTDSSSEKAKVTKKPMRLAIEVKSTDFSESTLKILGTITDGPEDIPRGEHHSFNLTENTEISIDKTWLGYQTKKLNEAVNNEKANILACIFNREEGMIAKLEQNSFRKISHIKGNVQKKSQDQSKVTDFFQELHDALSKAIDQYDPKSIILGCSHFWKTNFDAVLDKKEGKSYIWATIHDVNESALQELLRTKEVESALKDQHAIQDASLVEEVFKLIATDGAVCYGLKDCLAAAEAGAIATVLCSENYIAEVRDKGNFASVEGIFKTVDTQKGTVHLLSGKSAAIVRLNGLGGICAILRYKI
jgi:protein pelota